MTNYTICPAILYVSNFILCVYIPFADYEWRTLFEARKFMPYYLMVCAVTLIGAIVTVICAIGEAHDDDRQSSK